MKPHHSADRLEQPELELDAEPVAPASLADDQLLRCSLGLEHDDSPSGEIDRESDIDAQVVARLGIARADQVGRENAVGPGWSRTTFSLSRGLTASLVV